MQLLGREGKLKETSRQIRKAFCQESGDECREGFVWLRKVKSNQNHLFRVCYATKPLNQQIPLTETLVP